MTREELLKAAETLTRLGYDVDATVVRIAIGELDTLRSWLEVIAEAAKEGRSLQYLELVARDALREVISMGTTAPSSNPTRTFDS